jgi:hypothetical protein
MRTGISMGPRRGSPFYKFITYCQPVSGRGRFVGKLDKEWFTLSSGTDAKGALSLHLGSQALPKVDGIPVDRRSNMLFDSPLMKSVHGSGVVTIEKGHRKLTIKLGP